MSDRKLVVNFSASTTLEVRSVQIVNEKLAVVSFWPYFATAALDSGIPERKITEAAWELALQLVAERTGIEKGLLTLEKTERGSVYISPKRDNKFPMPA